MIQVTPSLRAFKQKAFSAFFGLFALVATGLSSGEVTNLTTDAVFFDLNLAIAAAEQGDTLQLSDGQHDPAGTVLLNKSLTLLGQSESGTILNIGGFNAWGIHVTANDVKLKNFTVQGDAASNQQFAVKIGTGNSVTGSPEDHFINTGFVIENVTIQDNHRTGLDFNGVQDAIVKNVTSTGAANGFGFSISSSAGISVEGITTSGNTWGDVGIFPANAPYAFPSIDAPTDIVFSGELNLSEGQGGISVQDGTLTDSSTWTGSISNNPGAGADVTVPAEFGHIVHGTRDFDGLVFHLVGEADAMRSVALSIVDNGGVSDLWLENMNDQTLEVVAGMSIQTAIDVSDVGDVIMVLPGIHDIDESVNVNKAVSLVGGDESTTILSCDGMSSGAYGVMVTASGATIQDFTVDGGAEGPVFGIHVQPGTSNSTLSGLTVKNCLQNGISFTGTNDAEGRNMVSDITVTNNGLVGIGFGASQNVTIGDVTASNNAGGDIGIYIGSYTEQPNDDLVFQEPLNLQNGISFTIEEDDPVGFNVVASTTDESDALYNADANVFVPAAWNHILQVDVPGNPSGSPVTPGLTSYTLMPSSNLSSIALGYSAIPVFSNIAAVSLATGNWVVAPGMDLQTAIELAQEGDQIDLLDGIHTIASTIQVNKPITIEGQSAAGVILDASDLTPLSSRVIVTDADDITLRNLTIKPIADPDPTANNGIGFTIKAGSNSVPSINIGLVLENIAIDGAAERTPFDFHGLTDVTLTGLSASGTTRGNGMSFSGCTNVIVNSFSGTNNAWGSIAVYASRFVPEGGRGSDSITILGSGLDIDGAVFSQDDLNPSNGDLYNTNVSVTGWDYEVYNDDFRGAYNDGPEYTFYADALSDATSQALALNAAGADGNLGSVIRQISNGQWRVSDPSLSIQTAANRASAGDKIVIAAGQFSESVVTDKPLILEGAANGTLMDAPVGEEPVFHLAAGNSETERTVLRLIEIQNAINGVSIGAHTTIDQVGSNGHSGYGLQLRSGSDMVITNSELGQNAIGISTISDAAISDVTITNTEFDGNAVAWSIPTDANAPVAFSGINVSNCTVKNSSEFGFEFNRLTNATLSNNQFEGNAVGLRLALLHGDSENINIVRNAFLNGSVAVEVSLAPGEDVDASPASLDGLTIFQNYMQGHANAVSFGADETSPLPSNLTLAENHFSQLTGLAVVNAGAGDLSIGCNWHGAGNVAGFQSTIGNDVEVVSVLIDGSDSDLETPGFQPAEDVTCATIGGCALDGACNYDPNATLLFPLDSDCDFDSCSGCTDEAACNYDGEATLSDNSLCAYPDSDQLDCEGVCINDIDEDGVCDEDEVLGCSDATACNYVVDSFTDADDSLCTYPEAQYDCNGNCLNDDDLDAVCNEFEVLGCTDDGACNYDPNATDENGSCEFASCAGCTVVSACNYDAAATISAPDQCVYPAEDYLDCDEFCLNDSDGDGVCDELEVPGCDDVAACNYNADATDSDDSCSYPGEYYDCNGACLLDSDGDGICNALEIPGCTFPNACNYDASATQENGTCEFLGCQGCTIEEACNFDSTASVSVNQLCTFPVSDLLDCEGNCQNDTNENGICDEEEVAGCTDASAANYNPNANVDDGCDALIIGCMIPSACNYDATATIMSVVDCTFDDCGDEPVAAELILLGEGCTDVYACNYEETAVSDDGSCEYNSCIGCTNPAGCDYDASNIYNGGCDFSCYGCTNNAAVNYNPSATVDDGSCLVYVYGCIIPSACNYDAGATLNDGSCDFESCVGCGEAEACNYDEAVTLNDVLTCTYPDEGYDCSGDCLADVDDDQICDPFEIVGCQNAGACNYNSAATDAAECIYPETHYDCNGDCVNDSDGDGVCDELEVSGCTFNTACNYDPTATEDDASCEFLSCVGCMEDEACNYDGTATLNDVLLCEYASAGYDCNDDCLVDSDSDGVCDPFEVLGCTDATACNFNDAATEADGSCTYPINIYGISNVDCAGVCLADVDNDGVCDGDEIEGCMDVEACNYDESATDDAGCEYLTCAGCNIPSACNYSPASNIINNAVCEFADAGFDCDGNCIDINNNSTCDFDEPTVIACFDAEACNFNAATNIIDNSLCIYVENDCDFCSGETNGTGSVVDNDSDDDGVCDPDEVTGCQDETACNFNTNATDPPAVGEECVFLTEPCDTCSGEQDGTGFVVDGDPDDDNICAPEEIPGCQDASACNYNVAATDPPAEGQACVYATDPCDVCSGLTDGTGFVVDGDVDGDGICNTSETSGCTYVGACNYDAGASEDNGSCIFATGCDTCSGETDGTGTVVDNDVDNDGVCDGDEIPGCLDVEACNYNQYATENAENCAYATGCDFCSGGISGDGFVVDGDANDNDICDIDDVTGCMDNAACNYAADATVDDGSCVIADEAACETCNEEGGIDVADADGDGVCDGLEVTGCQVQEACNYDADATEAGACVFPTGCDTCDGNGGLIDGDANNNGICDSSETPGCMDSSACNYNSSANVSDSSCVFADEPCETCEAGEVVLLDADADGVCDADEVEGCQNESACNYNSDATDEAACVFAVEACEACDGNGGVILLDVDNDGLCDVLEPSGCVGDETPPELVLDSIVVVDAPVLEWSGLDFVDQILDASEVALSFNDVPSMAADGTFQVTRLYYAVDACGQSATAGQILVASENLPGGCTYLDANNYDAAAVNNDGSCNFTSDCVTDINSDGQTGASDLLLMLSSFGQVCE